MGLRHEASHDQRQKIARQLLLRVSTIRAVPLGGDASRRRVDHCALSWPLPRRK